MAGLADTINRHDPDLVSLQELLTGAQVDELRRLLHGDYQVVYADGPLVGFTDPTLLIRTSRFRVQRTGGFWLGPRSPGFTLGWVLALPRRVEWAELEERTTGLRFTFAGTHFDARRRNSIPSAELAVKTVFPTDAPAAGICC